jgi:Protein of unknown function (DUF2934)
VPPNLASSAAIRRAQAGISKKASDLQARIRMRAYEVWELEGRQHGQDRDHWNKAEPDVAREDAAAPQGATRKPSRGSVSGSELADDPVTTTEDKSVGQKKKRMARKPSEASSAHAQKPEVAASKGGRSRGPRRRRLRTKPPADPATRVIETLNRAGFPGGRFA